MPEDYQVYRHNGRIWDRAYEGDVNITEHSELVYKSYARKQGSYFVNKIYIQILILIFLILLLLLKPRKWPSPEIKTHVWENISNEEILRGTKSHSDRS